MPSQSVLEYIGLLLGSNRALACEQQTHFRSSLLSLRRERSSLLHSRFQSRHATLFPTKWGGALRDETKNGQAVQQTRREATTGNASAVRRLIEPKPTSVTVIFFPRLPPRGKEVFPYICHIDMCRPVGQGFFRGFLRRFGLKTGIDFAHFGLESGMVFEGTTECMNVFIVSIPHE